jgi:hypothetical protein
MNFWESLYIKTYRQHNRLVTEPNLSDNNPLYKLFYFPRDLQHVPWHIFIRYGTLNTHKTGMNWHTATETKDLNKKVNQQITI